MKATVFTAQELLELTGVSKRQFYSYRYPPWCLVSPPIRHGRAFRYNYRHVTQLLLIRSYLLMGESLKRLWDDQLFLKTWPDDEHAESRAERAGHVGKKNSKLSK